MSRHTIVMWRKAEPTPLDYKGCTEKAYNAINVFNSLPKEYRPNYLTSNSKKTAKEMKWDLDNFRSVMSNKKKGNEADKKLGIGYNIGLFSSFNDKQSFGYSLHVGNTNSRLFNTFVVHIAPIFDMHSQENAFLIKESFQKAVNEFQPFWGCVYESRKEEKEVFFSEGIPIKTYWLNYISPELEYLIGESRLAPLFAQYPQATYQEGILQMQELPDEKCFFSL